MTTYEVKDSASWAVARQAAQPGDVIQLTDNISLPGDNLVPEGVTVDGGGLYSVTFPPDRRGFALASGATLRNLKIVNAKWGAYTSKPTKNVYVGNVDFVNVRGAALKFAEQAMYGTDGITVVNVRVKAAGTPTTLFDFGPGPTSNTFIDGCYIEGIDNPTNNTACDGIAVEKGLNDTIIRNTTVKGVGGDGIDVKGVARLYNVAIEDAVRNSMKLWRGGSCEKVSCVGSGAGAVVTWPTVFTDCYFEGGTSGGAALHVDDQGIGAPDSTFVRCAFTRKPESAGAYLLVCDSTAKVDFTDCRFWNGPLSDPYHHTVFYHGEAETVLALGDGKLTGAWPACMTGSVYEDTDAPEGVGYGGTVEPPVDPPPPPADTEPPKPGLFEVTGATDTTITLEVGPGTDNVGVVERLLRVYSEPEMSGRVLETSLGADTQYTVSGMVPDTQYYFVATWIDAAGNYVNAQCVGRTLPVAPPPPHDPTLEERVKALEAKTTDIDSSIASLERDGDDYEGSIMLQYKSTEELTARITALEERIEGAFLSLDGLQESTSSLHGTLNTYVADIINLKDADIEHAEQMTTLAAAVENSTNSYKVFRDRLRSAVGGEE